MRELSVDQQIQARTRVALQQRDLGLYFWALERTLGALRLIDPATVPARPRLLKRAMRNTEEGR